MQATSSNITAITENDIQQLKELVHKLEEDSAIRPIITGFLDSQTASWSLTDTEMTPSQAAEVLHVSRPYATLLMKKGFIKSYKVGTNWRASSQSVMDYIKEREQLNATQVEARYTRERDLQEALKGAKEKGRQRYKKMVSEIQGN